MIYPQLAIDDCETRFYSQIFERQELTIKKVKPPLCLISPYTLSDWIRVFLLIHPNLRLYHLRCCAKRGDIGRG